MKFFFLLLFLISYINAKGTISGKSITNSALIKYNLNGVEVTKTSNEDSFVVDRVVDIKLNWQDTKAVEIASGEKNRVLTFNLTNLGNGDDSIDLTHIAGDKQINPKLENIRLYMDSNNNGIWDSSDTIVSNLSLGADKNATLFIVSDTPDANYTRGEIDNEGIRAISKSINSNGKDSAAKVDTVVRNKDVSSVGDYIVREYWLDSLKSYKLNTKEPHTGSIITYNISLKIGGKSSGRVIDNIKFKDAIPDGTEYLDGSLKLNGVSLSDKKDNDNGEFDGSSVAVNISKIKESEIKNISFQVIIK